ncbi:MAG: hypothetical protein WDA60_07470 [Acidimicrobiia bacterium]|jgi:hypothetical protein
MANAPGYEDVQGAWGVGRVVVDGVITPWPVSQADIDDDIEAAVPQLASLGLTEGGLVLIVSLLSHAAQVFPFEQAAGRLGALYSSSDRSPFDAYRCASLIRQLRPSVVMGIDHRVLDGLEDAGRDLAEVFGPVPAVTAVDHDAHARLQAAGVDARWWLALGPASAVQPLDDDALRYDAARWWVEVDDSEGDLVVTSLTERLTPCARFRTGARGTIPEPGRLLLA